MFLKVLEVNFISCKFLCLISKEMRLKMLKVILITNIFTYNKFVFRAQEVRKENLATEE